jgi:hypothetical protein
MLSLLFIVRLRRMIDGTLGVDHEISSVLAKRGPEERPPSSLTHASSTRSAGQPPVGGTVVPWAPAVSPLQHRQGKQWNKEATKGGIMAGFLLR